MKKIGQMNDKTIMKKKHEDKEGDTGKTIKVDAKQDIDILDFLES